MTGLQQETEALPLKVRMALNTPLSPGTKKCDQPHYPSKMSTTRWVSVCVHLTSKPSYVANVIICSLQTKKLRLGEAQELARGHTASKWRKWNLSSGLWNPRIYSVNQMSELHHEHQPVFLDAHLICE